MASWRPNLSWITPTLAVGGCFEMTRAEHLALALRIRAVVDLRTEACDDEAALRRCGLTLLHLPTMDGGAVSDAMLDRGVQFVNAHLDRDERALIHCRHGVGRSATLALCVLVSRGLAPLDALALAKQRRSVVSPSAAQYQAWARWIAGWRDRHQAGWQVPDFEAFCRIAYRHLAGLD